MQHASAVGSSTDAIAARGLNLVVAGYATLAAGLIAFITINGGSSTPAAAALGTAALIAIGLLLAAAGMLRVARAVGSSAGDAFVLQSVGLIGLLLGLVIVLTVSSTVGYVVGAGFIVVSGASALTGTVLLNRNETAIGQSYRRAVNYLTAGVGLVFLGAAVVAVSNIAFQYWISQLENTIYVDIGATVSACGCVVAACSLYVLGSARLTAS